MARGDETTDDQTTAQEDTETWNRLKRRLRSLLAPSEYDRVLLARDFVKRSGAHAQERAEKTVNILVEEVHCTDPDLIVALLLRDIPTHSAKNIEDAFGTRVARIIVRITQHEDEQFDYAHRLYNYGTWEDLLVKACDYVHTLNALKASDPAWQRKQISEAQDHYRLLWVRLGHLIPPHLQDGWATLEAKIGRLAREGQSRLG